MGVLLLVAGALLLALAVHPFSTYPASLALVKKLSPRSVRDGHVGATAALCVCAFNEERVIRAKAENMLELRDAFPGLSLAIYVDGATDRTREILAGFEPDISVVASDVRHGKTHGMNTLVARTNAEFLVFSDANVRLAPDAISRLLAPFGDPHVGGVCGHLRYLGSEKGATALAGSLYWRLEENIKRLESATGSVMGADGSLFAIRRVLHRPVPVDLIEDMYVSLSVLCAGYRLVRAEDAIAMEEVTSGHKEEFRRKIRISCQAFNVHTALAPRLRHLGALDRYKYVSHKLLRWFTIYLLAVGGICVAGGVAVIGGWWAVCALLVAEGFALGWIALGRSAFSSGLRSALSAFLATGIGVLRSFRGDRFQTWTPPGSARVPNTAPSRANT